MKNKIILCSLIIVIMSFNALFNFTNSSYYYKAKLTGPLDYIRTASDIKLYNPNWIGGYTEDDNGNGWFEVSSIPLNYPNIHYRVTNKEDNKINTYEVEYYIRVVAEDNSDDLPIEYDVHEFNNTAETAIYNFEDGVGYGPFTLQANTTEEVVQLYSIKANFVKSGSKYTKSMQNLKVQMVRKREDGTLKVMNEAPLNMKYIGQEILDTVPVTFAYYTYYLGGTKNQIGVQILRILKNTTINFNDSDQLAELGITLPNGYSFHDVRGTLVGYDGYKTSVTIPNEESTGYFLEVYMMPNDGLEIGFKYWENKGGNGEQNVQIGEQKATVLKGQTLNFKDKDLMASLGLTFPEGYEFDYANCQKLDPTLGSHDSFTIPTKIGNDLFYINVFFKKIDVVQKLTVKTDVGDATITLNDSGQYTFTTPTIKRLFPDWDSGTSFTIYIFDILGNSMELGNTYINGSVIVDVNQVYTSGGINFSFKEKGSYLKIINWW